MAKFKVGDVIWLKRDRTRSYNVLDISTIEGIDDKCYRLTLTGGGRVVRTRVIRGVVDENYELVPELAKVLYV